MAGHSQRNEIMVYDLPERGTGTDPSQWPIVEASRLIPSFWTGGYANGVAFMNGKLWVSPRTFYDTSPPPDMTLFAEDGEKIVVALPRQSFSGFVKSADGSLMLGSGGYESGQGSCSGPSLAKMDGTPLIRFGWPGTPGTAFENWNLRCPREPNYYPINHTNDWVAWEPQPGSDGVMQGRWASDRVLGGGLVLPEGICYWAYMGTGELSYARQSETFGDEVNNRTYKYVFDKSTYQLKSWELVAPTNVRVCGQDVGPDGKVYLNVSNVWSSGRWQADPALHVYG